MILFREVFEQDHVVLFISVVNKHRPSSHAQHLKDTRGVTTGFVESPLILEVLGVLAAYLRKAHQHQQREEVGAFQRLGKLPDAVVGEGSDDRAPLRTSIQTVQNVCHRACPVQANTTAKLEKKHAIHEVQS